MCSTDLHKTVKQRVTPKRVKERSRNFLRNQLRCESKLTTKMPLLLICQIVKDLCSGRGLRTQRCLPLRAVAYLPKIHSASTNLAPRAHLSCRYATGKRKSIAATAQVSKGLNALRGKSSGHGPVLTQKPLRRFAVWMRNKL